MYWEREWRDWEGAHRRGEPLRLTPVVPVVLHTGPRPWNTSRTMADLFGGPPELRAYAPAWAAPPWDLPEHPPRELIETGKAWWQFLAVVRSEGRSRTSSPGCWRRCCAGWRDWPGPIRYTGRRRRRASCTGPSCAGRV